MTKRLKPEFSAGQEVMIIRTYNGERFTATLKKRFDESWGGSWSFTRRGIEYEKYMRPLTRGEIEKKKR